MVIGGGRVREEARWAGQGMKLFFIVRGFVICGVQVERIGEEGQAGKLRRDRGEQVVREAGTKGWGGA